MRFLCEVLTVCSQHNDEEWKFKEQHANMWENIAGAKRYSRPRRPRPSDASALHDTNWTELEKLLCPRPTAEEALSDTEIRPSVCSVEQLAACSLATAGHQRCADCGPVRGWT